MTLKLCCLCGKKHKEGECKFFSKEDEKLAISRINKSRREEKLNDLKTSIATRLCYVISGKNDEETWKMAEAHADMIIEDFKALLEEKDFQQASQ